MNNIHRAILLITGFILTSSAVWAGSNLVANGHFNATNEFLYHWKYDYADTGNSNYSNNCAYVALTNVDSRSHVVALRANYDLLVNQGVMLDSDPIAVAPGGRYTFTVSAKTTGPNCHILVEGYRWRPGIKPHANPKLAELRKCYRFAQVAFGPTTRTSMNLGMITPSHGWATVSQTFPDSKMTDLAKESYDKIQFLVVHILAVSGTTGGQEWGTLYVDDIKLERIN